MTKSIFISAITIPFLVGLGFGFKLNLGSRIQSHLGFDQTPVLRVAAPPEALPEDLIESFNVQHSVSVQIVPYADPEALFLSLADAEAKIDLVLVNSSLIPRLIEARLIQKLDVDRVLNLQNVAADFLDNPAEHGVPFSVPLLWGLQDMKKTKTQEQVSISAAVVPTHLFQPRGPASRPSLGTQRSALWVRSMVLPAKLIARDLTYEFMNYFLEPEVALELSTLTLQSSTNRTIESSELSSHLKPSHLRRQKLSEILRPSAKN